MGDKIQIGIDIATSISVIGAAISFMLSQRSERKRQQARYAVDNLKDLLSYLRKASLDYDEIGNKLRETLHK